jgi:hypothetical protein
MPILNFGQTTFYKESSVIISSWPTDTVHRVGPDVISHAFPSAYQNRLMVTGKYDSTNNCAEYFSLNGNPSTIGLATSSDKEFVTIDANVVLHRQNAQSVNSNFKNTNTTLHCDHYLCIHEGSSMIYTLPTPNS